MSGHTPGPWALSPSPSPFPWVVESPTRGDEVAHAPINSGNTHAEDEANARLIAAAPALLEALESVGHWNAEEKATCWCSLPEMIPYRGHDSGCEEARAAIALVKGLKSNDGAR